MRFFLRRSAAFLCGGLFLAAGGLSADPWILDLNQAGDSTAQQIHLSQLHSGAGGREGMQDSVNVVYKESDSMNNKSWTFQASGGWKYNGIFSKTPGAISAALSQYSKESGGQTPTVVAGSEISNLFLSCIAWNNCGAAAWSAFGAAPYAIHSMFPEFRTLDMNTTHSGNYIFAAFASGANAQYARVLVHNAWDGGWKQFGDPIFAGSWISEIAVDSRSFEGALNGDGLTIATASMDAGLRVFRAKVALGSGAWTQLGPTLDIKALRVDLSVDHEKDEVYVLVQTNENFQTFNAVYRLNSAHTKWEELGKLYFLQCRGMDFNTIAGAPVIACVAQQQGPQNNEDPIYVLQYDVKQDNWDNLGGPAVNSFPAPFYVESDVIYSRFANGIYLAYRGEEKGRLVVAHRFNL